MVATVDEHLARAQEATGLTDFGDDDVFGGDGWRTGLRRLVASFADEARLHDIGEVSVDGDLQSYLVNRLRLVQRHRERPDLREQPITEPLVIVGQARTGTTMLFDLLAQDPDHRVPQTWEVDQPFPAPRTETYDSDPRIAEVDATFAMVDAIIPEFRGVHQLGAQLAQECIRMTGGSFVSLIFPTQHHLPGYLDWLLHDAVDDGYLAGAYTWHRRYLEHLQSEAPGTRWLLKTPAHTWTLPQLVAEYPDARLIQTHRDPATVIASTASLVAMLRRLSTDAIDVPAIAAEFEELILGGLERSVDARLDGTIASDRVVDLQFRDVMADPLAAARSVYDALGWDCSPESLTAMQRFLDGYEREGSGHHYTFEQTGLDRAAVRSATERYTTHFGVRLEGG